MKKTIQFIFALLTVLIAHDALAVCSGGFRVGAIQNSDIQLTAGVKAYLPVTYITVDLPAPLETDCGVYARSDVPGVSLVSAYGIVPPVSAPSGTWTPVGVASAYPPGAQQWFGTFGERQLIFAVVADGTTPAGTQGRITLGVNNSEFNVLPRTIGYINVVVGAQNANTATWFSVVSTATTISANQLILDHPLLNSNPSAKVFVQHVYNPSGQTARTWNHPIAGVYNSTRARWTVHNVDNFAMVAGLGFNVNIDPSARQIYTGNPLTSPPVSSITINDPISNNNPYATIVVGTYFTSGVTDALNAHPVAVRYVAPNWQIFNADRTNIPAGVRFNIKVIGFSEYHTLTLTPSNSDRLDFFVSNAAGVSADGLYSTATQTRPINFWWQLGKPALPIVVTPNATPAGITGTVDSKYIGLRYVDGAKPQWGVMYEDQTVVSSTASFNVAGKPQVVAQ